MTKEPQPTTHNIERGARGTCRDRSEAGSSPKRTEKKVGCSLIGEISWRFTANCSAVWRKHVARHVGDLEETCLEKNYLAIFGEKCVGVLEKTFGDFWREPFGDFGDLENFIRRNRGRQFGEIVQRFWRKPFGDFGDRYGVS